MALNESFVGRSFAPTATYVVGREKVREFATAIGDDNAAFHDVAAARALGYADVVAPPTFAFVIAYAEAIKALADPDLGLDYSRVVHSDQSFAYTRPIVAGDELQVTTVIESVRVVAGNDMVTAKGVVTTVSGDPVVTTTMSVVARAAADEAGA